MTRSTIKAMTIAAFSAIFASALFPASANGQSATHYIYDELGRLKSATYDGEVGVAYVYDAAGNRAAVHVGAPAGPNPTNHAPVANPDDSVVTFFSTTPIMVLLNDTDPDGNALTVTAVDVPTGGSALIGPGGSHVVYGAPNVPGVYTFTYTISDGAGGSATATVTIFVESGFPGGCNPPPGQMCEVDPLS